MDTDAQRRYLLRDGNLGVPCSRYGFDTESCVPVALSLAALVTDANGEPDDWCELLDHMMSLVVNDHDDPATLIPHCDGLGTGIGVDGYYQCTGCAACEDWGEDWGD
jgi:hypothetical protein